MQNVIRKTALARNQGRRKTIRALKSARRSALRDSLKQRFAYDRMEIDNIRAEKQRRREDWIRGPLAPRRDAGADGKNFGAFSPQALNPPEVPQHLRRKYFNFAAGDRVCIMKGKDKGKINEISSVNKECETVTVKDLNVSDVSFPPWLLGADEGSSFRPLSVPISIDDVRLVVALDDPATGVTRDVLVEHMHGGRPILEQEYGVDTPRHTRYISGVDIEIPWPRPEAAPHQDEEWDTLRMEVESWSWRPSLERAPFPSSVIDELRNKYSKYRIRHDPEYVKNKKLEEYRREYIQSQSMMTPKGEFLAMQSRRNAGRKLGANGKRLPLDLPTSQFIHDFISKNSKKTKAGAAA